MPLWMLLVLAYLVSGATSATSLMLLQLLSALGLHALCCLLRLLHRDAATSLLTSIRYCLL